jgi:hypothetical protein
MHTQPTEPVGCVCHAKHLAAPASYQQARRERRHRAGFAARLSPNYIAFLYRPHRERGKPPWQQLANMQPWKK